MTNNKLANWLNFGSSILLFICALSAIFMAVVYTRRTEPVKTLRYEIKYELAGINKDSLSVLSQENLHQTKRLRDSLMYYCRNFEEAYNHFQKYKVEQDNFLHYCLGLITVIAGVVGFLGFKNFHDIKVRAEKIAEEIAKEIAGKIATKVSMELYKQQDFKELQKRIEEEVEKSTADYYDTFNEEFETKLEEIEFDVAILKESMTTTVNTPSDLTSNNEDLTQDERVDESPNMNINEPV